MWRKWAAAYTRLMTFDRRTVFIPNSTVTSSNIVNYTMDGKRRVEIEVSASYDADLDRVKAALRQALDTVGGFYEDPAYFIHVKGYGESAVEYSVPGISARATTTGISIMPCWRKSSAPLTAAAFR